MPGNLDLSFDIMCTSIWVQLFRVDHLFTGKSIFKAKQIVTCYEILDFSHSVCFSIPKDLLSHIRPKTQTVCTDPNCFAISFFLVLNEAAVVGEPGGAGKKWQLHFIA